MCREISPQEVIVSLIHPKNTSSRRAPKFEEPNGCHYGFNEKLFAVVSQIGEELNTSAQKESESGACVHRDETPSETLSDESCAHLPQAQKGQQA
jgi:hypothetical protein